MRKQLLIGLSGLLIVALLAVGVFSAVSGAKAQAGTATPVPTGTRPAQDEPASDAPRTLAVNGSGKVFLAPDIATVNIGVHSQGSDAAETVAENNQKTQDLIDALTQFGVDEKDLQTSNFTIWPNQQYDPQGQPTGEVTYMVDNMVIVTVRDLETIGDLLDTVIQAGANSINGITFDVADKTAALSEARKAAVTDARTIAGELAEAAGVELGQVQAISMVSSGYPGPIFDGRGGGMAAAEAASVPVAPGQIQIAVDVNVVFSIR